MTRLEIRPDNLSRPKVFLDEVKLEGAFTSRWHRLNDDNDLESEEYTIRSSGRLKKFDAKIADVDVPKIYLLLKEWIVGPYQKETLASYLHKKGFSLLERSEPILPPSQEIPALPPVEEDEDADSQ